MSTNTKTYSNADDSLLCEMPACPFSMLCASDVSKLYLNPISRSPSTLRAEYYMPFHRAGMEGVPMVQMAAIPVADVYFAESEVDSGPPASPALVTRKEFPETWLWQTIASARWAMRYISLKFCFPYCLLDTTLVMWGGVWVVQRMVL